MQFSRLVLVTMACLLVFADAGLEDPPDQVADLGLVHAVIPVTMRGITGRFWWSPIRSLPFQPGFRVGNPPFQKSSSIFDVTTGGRGDFYTRDSNTPPEILASACVLLFMSIQGVALPLWGGISREGKMVGFLHSPLNRGVPCSRLVCGNAGIEAMSPMAGLAFNSVRNSVAKSVVLFRRVLLLLAFAGYHALMIRELRFVLDVNDDSFSHLDDLRRADMTDSEFRFAMILYVQGMAASAFDSIFLRSLRTLWTGRFQNCLFNECRFAAAISRIAPLCTGVLVRNEGKNMQFGLSRQFSEEAFVSPTTNRVFAADENDAIDFEESSLRVIRDCVDGDCVCDVGCRSIEKLHFELEQGISGWILALGSRIELNLFSARIQLLLLYGTESWGRLFPSSRVTSTWCQWRFGHLFSGQIQLLLLYEKES